MQMKAKAGECRARARKREEVTDRDRERITRLIPAALLLLTVSDLTSVYR